MGDDITIPDIDTTSICGKKDDIYDSLVADPIWKAVAVPCAASNLLANVYLDYLFQTDGVTVKTVQDAARQLDNEKASQLLAQVYAVVNQAIQYSKRGIPVNGSAITR